MRAVRRTELSIQQEAALQALIDVVQATPAAPADLRKKVANLVWLRKPRPLKAGTWMLDALTAGNFGQDRCMFCESNESSEVDHFVPKSVDPPRVAAWDNLILACARCNGPRGKGATSPFIPGTTTLAILDPAGVAHDPADHLDYSAQGNLTGRTPLGVETVRRLKLSSPERPKLVRDRKTTWRDFNRELMELVGARVANQADRELSIKERLCTRPFAGMLIYLLQHVQHPDAGVIFDADTLAALRAYPDIVAELLAFLRPP